MDLTLKGKTDMRDLVIDYIEVQLKNGMVVTLNWDESGADHGPDGFIAWYSGVCFDELHADGLLEMLEGLKVLTVQTYSDAENREYPNGENLDIISMKFMDGADTLLIEAPFTSIPRQAVEVA